MSRRTLFALIPFSVLLGGCAIATTLEPISFTPTYKVTEKNAPVFPAEPCAALSKVTVEDARAQKQLGSRMLQENSSVTQPVNLQGDVTGWVRDGVGEMLQRATIKTGVDRKPELKVKIDRLSLSENVHRLADYKSRIDLAVEVTAVGETNACWSAQLSGTGENGGKPGYSQNYEETVNRALNQALLQLVHSRDFSAKLCGACAK